MNVVLDWTTASKHVQTHLDHITVAVSLDLNWKGFLTVQVRGYFFDNSISGDIINMRPKSIFRP